MKLIFLGTSSGTPTRTRNTAALALILDDGRTWLIDCGEAAQHRILATEIRPGRIERVLLTHLHGDHCYGLPGLLSSIAIHHRGPKPVELIGPPGLKAWIRHTLEASVTHLPFRLEVRELQGAEDLGWRGPIHIQAVPVAHRIPCWAYLFTERDRPGHLLAAAARALGVPPGPLMGQLAAGERVHLADGREVGPDGLLGPTQPGRRIVVVGDTDDAGALIPAAAGCDVLVHECTFAADHEEQARAWGHSTTAMVAAFARQLRPRRLVLTHFSSRYTTGDERTVEDLLAEVRAAYPDQNVEAADDLWTLELRR